MSWEIGIYRRWIFMKCPYCGDEMIRGYLMSSRDITFAVDNPTKVFFVLKNRTIWNWVKVQQESLIVKLIVAVVAKRFWLIMQIDKSWTCMYFPLFLPLWVTYKGNLCLLPCNLIQKSCEILLCFPRCVSVNIHCGTNIGMSQQLLDILWLCSVWQKIGGVGMP